MGIPPLYTGCGGQHPATTLPILLDVGWRHERVLEDLLSDPRSG
jgi:hypothetical protein